MNLYTIISKLQNIATTHKLVNEVANGDIYEWLNSGEHKYGCVFTTITNITEDENQMQTVNLNIFYVDRLLADKTNELQIQSVAVTTLKQILKRLEDTNSSVVISRTNFVPFTEKFADFLAGAYCGLALTFDSEVGCVNNNDFYIYKTIQYVSEYGQKPANKTVSVPYTLTEADLPTLTEEGYEFMGWDKNVGDVITSDTTITADWELEHKYLTFKSTGNSTISFYNIGNNPNIEYSLDNGENWTEWNYSAISLSDGEKVLMRGHNEEGFNNDNTFSRFEMTGSIAASGNIMSLIDGEVDGTKTIPCRHCFDCLFSGCSSLTSSPELPAVELSDGCYAWMFCNCTSLTKAPELPCTYFGSNSDCYAIMFRGCTSLETAPELPVTLMTSGCYEYMFDGCTSLVNVPKKLGNYTSTYSCEAMFRGCTSLETAPELPAQELNVQSYKEMFLGCRSLKYIKCLAEYKNASSCLAYWVEGVAANGTFVKKAGVTWYRGYSAVPNNWAIEEE